jgi:hypothetical protein
MTIPRKSRVDAAVTSCVMLTRDGAACGKPGQAGLPAGICPEHAIAVYRAVAKLVTERAKAN